MLSALIPLFAAAERPFVVAGPPVRPWACNSTTHTHGLRTGSHYLCFRRGQATLAAVDWAIETIVNDPQLFQGYTPQASLAASTWLASTPPWVDGRA